MGKLFFASCLSTSVSSEDYKLALKSFHFFRKVCVKVIPNLGVHNDEKLNVLGDLELFLSKATHSSPTTRLSKRQKTELMTKILLVKQNVERLNPAKGVDNAAC